VLCAPAACSCSTSTRSRTARFALAGRQARELEKDYVREQSGQTMHFFSAPYLRELLREWRELRLDPVQIASRETGEPFKQVWRGLAHR
jgi:hypothetical protein